MTFSKEERRRQDARKRQRKLKIVKGAVIGLSVAIAPLLVYVATRI